MNNKRRSKIKEAIEHLERADTIVSNALDDEQDCLYNMPENLEGSDRYEQMEDAVYLLEQASNLIEEAKDKLEDASG